MATQISKKRKVRLASRAPEKGCASRQAGCRQLHPIFLTSYCLSDLQFVADGVFYAELNELLTRELAEHGYSGVEVRVTPIRTEIIIRATRTQNVLGESFASLAHVAHQTACSASCRPKLYRLGVHITGPCCPCGCSLCPGMG